MTVGELIDEAAEYLNAGSSQVNDADLRLRYLRAAQKGCDRAWTLRPMDRRLASGTVALILSDDGIGLAPANFGSAGPKMHVYVQNGQREVRYMEPAELFDLRERFTDKSQWPEYYTFRGSTGGRQNIAISRRNSGALTLTLENYQVKTPKLVDRPGRCVLAEGVAGLPNGAYTYKVTFVTADGETEGGQISESITVALKKIQLTNILVSPASSVTSRKIYRTVAGGEQHKLVATIADNVTTTYLDNIADGSLGANVPTTATGISGLEKFPEDHHRTALLTATIRLRERGEGDGRAPIDFPPDVMLAFMQMWADDRPQNTVRRSPAYGSRALGRWWP